MRTVAFAALLHLASGTTLIEAQSSGCSRPDDISIAVWNTYSADQQAAACARMSHGGSVTDCKRPSDVPSEVWNTLSADGQARVCAGGSVPVARSQAQAGRASDSVQPAKPRWWELLASGLAAFAEGYSRGQQARAETPIGSKLMLFGGRNNTVYLGCVSCGRLESDSLHNTLGDYGSRYSSDSIFNTYGEYGSKYSDYSPCNRYGQEPPVIVDREGNFYGRLTVNTSHHQRTRSAELRAFVAGLCGG